MCVYYDQVIKVHIALLILAIIETSHAKYVFTFQDCNGEAGLTNLTCETLTCNIKNLTKDQVYELQLKFYLWASTMNLPVYNVTTLSMYVISDQVKATC